MIEENRLTRLAGYVNGRPVYTTKIDMRRSDSTGKLKCALGRYEDTGLSPEEISELKNSKIPMRPEVIEKHYFVCPSCKQELGISSDDIYVYDVCPPKFCSNCGQALEFCAE